MCGEQISTLGLIDNPRWVEASGMKMTAEVSTSAEATQVEESLRIGGRVQEMPAGLCRLQVVCTGRAEGAKQPRAMPSPGVEKLIRTNHRRL